MINLPFNFQPTSAAVKTSSYTIPSGSYAHVTAYVENGGTFTIGGSAALVSQIAVSSNVINVSQFSSSGITSYTVPTGYYFTGRVTNRYQPGVGISVGGTSIYGTLPGNDTASYAVEAGAGDVVAAQAGLSGTVTLSGYARRVGDGETNVSASFWVPTGTVIAGTGTWKATVSLFNEIS